MSLGTGFGVTIQGFIAPQLTDLKTDLEQGLEAQFGKGINLEPESFFGQEVGLIAERLSLVWAAMQDVYNSQTPNTAFGASLDNVGALRGIPRLEPTNSYVQNYRIFGTTGAIVPNTFQVAVIDNPLSIFQLGSNVTLGVGQSSIQNIAFSAVAAAGNWSLNINGSATPSLPFNATAAQVQTAIQALNFCSACTVTGNMTAGFVITFVGKGTGGFMVQPLFGVTTNTLQTIAPAPITITPSMLTPGIDQANVTMTATVTGPISANASALTNILTPVSGVSAVLNTQDAHIGTDVETDNAYRARMSKELQIAGAGTVPAIRSRLLGVPGVTSVLVYENIMDVPDGHGRYPHSFEAVVSGGTDSDIANMIWQVKPAGIATFGNTSFVITDSQGIQHTIYFSRPTPVGIYYIINIRVTNLYPVDGDTAVKEAIANFTNSLDQGQSVIIVPQVIAQLVGIPGIDDAGILAGIVPGPTLSVNIVIEPYEQAFTQTDFIVVNHVLGEVVA